MMNIEETYSLCALNRIFGFEPKLAHALISHLGSASEVFRMSAKDMDLLLGPYSKFKGRINIRAYHEAAEELERFSGKDIRFIGFGSDPYPELLTECEDAPLGLYVRSRTDPHDLFAEKRNIAVVGTRDISAYGQEWCRRIIFEFGRASKKPVIVSGLALGTDICAHAAALEAGIPTIGVMATGPESIYPYRHREIAERMVSTPGCALITDYPPGTAPLAIHFLRRNRIIAGMSEALILVESKTKGGGMMTSRLAFSYNRDVFALPGRVDDLRSQGCNHLIKNKIAEPIGSAEDLITSLGFQTSDRIRGMSTEDMLGSMYKGRNNGTDIAQMCSIVRTIKANRGITLDEISASTGLDYQNTVHLVSIMEMDGLISIDLLQRCTINTRNSR